MFLANKSPQSYVELYQKFLYKSFSLLLTPPPRTFFLHLPNVDTAAFGPKSTVFCAPQEAALICSDQCTFTKCPADAAIGQFPCDSSIPSEMLKPFIRIRFLLFCDHYLGDLLLCQAVVWEEGTSEGLFEKEYDTPPPEIHNSTTPPSSQEYLIEDGIFNASNQAEDIVIVMNQGLEVDDNIRPAPKNVPLV